MIFKTEPLPHQLEAFEKLKNKQYFALLADMGTGKTKIGIDIAQYRQVSHVVVLAPKKVTYQWTEEEIPKHYPYDFEYYNFSSAKTIKNQRALDQFLMSAKRREQLHVLTINYEALLQKDNLNLLHAFLKGVHAPMIIADEASRIKNPNAKSVKNLKLVVRKHPNAIRAVMTGTPAAKSPVDMYSIFDFLLRNFFRCSYKAFEREYTYIYERTFQQQGNLVRRSVALDYDTFQKIKLRLMQGVPPRELAQKTGLSISELYEISSMSQFKNARNLEKLKKSIAPVSFSIKKSECFSLPEKIYRVENVELTKDQRVAIDSLKKYAMYVHEKGELTLQNKAVLGLRILQICGGFIAADTYTLDAKKVYDCVPLPGANPKLTALLEDIDEIGEQQFIVWAVFRAELELLSKKLHGVAEYVAGDEDDAIQRFKRGGIQALIMNPEVGGYGLNLQHCGLQYWFSRNYRTEARLQAEDRSHRYGIVESPMYKDIVAECKFEYKVLDSLREGKDINDVLTSTTINDIF